MNNNVQHSFLGDSTERIISLNILLYCQARHCQHKRKDKMQVSKGF